MVPELSLERRETVWILPGHALGRTTSAPEVEHFRSSRTRK